MGGVCVCVYLSYLLVRWYRSPTPALTREDWDLPSLPLIPLFFKRSAGGQDTCALVPRSRPPALKREETCTRLGVLDLPGDP